MKILINNTDVSDYIYDLQYEGVQFDEYFYIGATFCTSLKISYQVEDFDAVPQTIQITDDNGNKLLPTFYVYDFSDEDDIFRNVTAYDSMLYGNAYYFDAYPLDENGNTIGSILNNISTSLGELKGTDDLIGLTKVTSMQDDSTMRDFLTMIGQYNWGYWFIDKDDKLAFKSYNDDSFPTKEYNLDMVADIDVGNEMKITRLQHSVGTYPLEGDDETTFVLEENNHMIETEDDIRVIYENANLTTPFSIHPINVENCDLIDVPFVGEIIVIGSYKTIAQPNWSMSGGWIGGFSFSSSCVLKSSDEEKIQISLDRKLNGIISITKNYTDGEIITKLGDQEGRFVQIEENASGLETRFGQWSEDERKQFEDLYQNISKNQEANALEFENIKALASEALANSNKANTLIREDPSLGIVIGRQGSDHIMNVDEKSANFYVNSTKVAEFGSEGSQVAQELRIGNNLNRNNSWRIYISGENDSHLTFIRKETEQ